VRALLASDLHLSEDRPEANERFIAFLEGKARSADALYLLGDVFEYWIGDDDLAQPFNAVIAGLLHDLTRRGVRLRIMHGNRDFLVGERFCGETGAGLLQDPTVEEICGVRTLLMHGDTLCTDDLDYQAWRRTARSRAWQQEFLAQPLAERRSTILRLREESKAVIQAKPAEIMDVNGDAVHGHTHRPGHHSLQIDARPCERWVLPDWYGRGGYLEIAAGEPRLVRF
jgi:UDP-2,3-diacylglucosamine hydrolase